MPQLISIPIYPGGRNSDRSENELGVSQHLEVLNADIGKLGEWAKRPYYRQLNYPLRWQPAPGAGYVTAGNIISAIEHRGWLIVYTDMPGIFRVKIDSNGDYVGGPVDAGASSVIQPPSGFPSLITNPEIVWVERGNFLRLVILDEGKQDYFKITYHDPKEILAPDGSLLHTYAEESLKDETALVVLGEPRDLGLADPVNAYMYSSGDISDPKTDLRSSTEYLYHFWGWKTSSDYDDWMGMSLFVGVGVIDEAGQIFPIKYLPTVNFIDGEVYRGAMATGDYNIAELLGFDVIIDKTKFIYGSIQSIVVFGSRDPDAVIWGTKSDGGRSIPLLDPSHTWRIIDEIPIANGLFDEHNKYFVEGAFVPATDTGGLAMVDNNTLRWTYQGLYTGGGNMQYEGNMWKMVPWLSAGAWIEIFMDDGSYIPPTRIMSSAFNDGVAPDDVAIVITTENSMADIRDGSGYSKLGQAFTIRIYKSFFQDLVNADHLKAHFVADMRTWTELPLIQDTYPYNVFAKDLFPPVNLYQIAGERSYAITPRSLEQDYLRYSAPGQYDMLPEDQLMEVGTVEVFDIVPRRNAIALITNKGIIQGSLVSGVFNQDIDYTRAGAIKRGAHVVIDDLIFFLGGYDLFMNNGNTSNALLEANENRDYYQENLNLSLSKIGYDKNANQLLIIMDFATMLIYDYRTTTVFLHDCRINGGPTIIDFFYTEEGSMRFISDDGNVYGFDSSGPEYGETRVIIKTKLLDADRRYKTKKLKEIRIPVRGISRGLQVILTDRDDGRTKTIPVNTKDSTEFYEYRLWPGFVFRSLDIQIDDAPASPRSDNNFQIKLLNLTVQTW